MNISTIFSKTGKGVQEASGKTSHLSRSDRAVLSAIDGKTSLAEVQKKFEKIAGPKFEALIQQLDKDGFIREVSGGAAPAASASSLPRAQPKAAGPAAKAPPPSEDLSEGLDFTQAMKMPSKAPAAAPKAPPVDLAAAARAEAERKAKEQAATDYKARQEAEARAAAEAKAKAEFEAKARAAAEAKAKADAEAKARAEAEARARAAAEAKGRADAEAKARAEAEAKARDDAESKAKAARDMALRRAAEAKAKAEAEAKDKARLEAELKSKLEEERRAREDAEKRAAEAADKARKEIEEKAKRREEEDRRRKEEDERRAKEEAERRAREEAERKAREEEDRKRRGEEDRRRREEDERRRKEEDERRAREEEERKRRAKEDEERRAREESDRRARQESERKAKEEAERKAKEAALAPAPAAASGGIGDSLLADLDSFTQREEEERQAKEEAERKAKEEAERKAKEETARRAREEEEKKRREEEERRAKEEAERKAKEEEERRAREEEQERKREEEERKRKAKEALAAKQAETQAAEAKQQKPEKKAAAKAKGTDDIEVSDEDLDLDDVKRDEKALSKEARRAAKEREQPVAATVRRPVKWGRPAAIALFVVLVGGVGALHVMPLSTAEYEKAASEALGVPVKVGSARLSVITGVQVNLENISVGDAIKIGLARGYPEIGSLFGPKKLFSRIELEGASVTQAQLGEAAFGKIGGENFRVGRVVVKQVKLDGPLTLPALDADAAIGGDGRLQSIALTGPDKLSVRLTPRGSEVGFEVSAGSLALPFVPGFTLSDFGWKGTATRQGITSSEFDGRAFDGLFSGNARVRWGTNWVAEGELRARGARVAVFAPTLVSEGKVEGRSNFSMSGPAPARLGETARLEGSFKIENGVIGNFALRRALETGGAQTGGRTEFAELAGQGVYDKGAVQLRGMQIVSGALNAGASLDIDAGGALAGKISAEVKTPNQTLRAVLNISGSLQNPVIRK